MRVFCDPGHGQGTGVHTLTALGSTLVEDSLNFQVAKVVETVLEGYGHLVMLSRYDDSYPSKALRALTAAQFRADVVLCIHHNAARNSEESLKYAKTEIYYSAPSFIVPDDGHPGLETVFNRVRVYELTPSPDDDKAWMNRVRNVVNPYYRQGISETVLIECGYLDNPEHQKIINQPGYPTRMGKMIANWVDGRIKKAGKNETF